MPRKRVRCDCGEPLGPRGQRLVSDTGEIATVCPSCAADCAPALVRLQHDRQATDRDLARTYRITLENYEARLMKQGGRCAICLERPTKERRLAVDHDHETGAVRGLLCGRCNTAIGLLRDDVASLARAIVYLHQ